MEFMNRGNNMQQPGGSGAPQHGPSAPATKNGKRFDKDKTWRVASVALLFGITILIVALAFLFTTGPRKEGNFVENGKMQAVFLNGGQVYFGKITDLNDKYLRMEDIFYLRVNQTVQPNQANNQAGQNDISLVKLGCELHRPTNEMVINRSQVVFWENLKDEAGENTVPGAVKNYKTQYPDGQECQDVNAQNNAGATTNTNNTTPATDNGSAAGTQPAGTDNTGTDTGAGAPTNQ